MDYSQLSDFEINKLVAKATDTQIEETYQFVNGGEDIADHMSGIVLMRKITSNRKHWKLYDPCNKPEDAWPIISGHKLSIINADDEWLCVPEDTAVDGITGDDVQMIYSGDGHIHANPLRAAMIVFLMKQDNNHA